MSQNKKALNWPAILFLTISPVVGVFGTVTYTYFYGFNIWEFVTFLFLIIATAFSITAGYHRYFSHRSYGSHPMIRLFFLIFGACAFQNSVLQWASDHRRHHKNVDGDGDPYNIKQGAWYAHILWMFHKRDEDGCYENVPDLKKDPMVIWQERYWILIAVVVGFGLPVLIGHLIGRPFGGLLWGGALRIVIVHHFTFFVNSLAHMWGTRPYTLKESARDSWVVALLTMGEGYHNFHHRFPSDYRNGLRWFQWDPSKWLIRSLSLLGLTKRLVRTDPDLILKVKLDVTMSCVRNSLKEIPQEKWTLVHSRLEVGRKKLENAMASLTQAKTKYRAVAALQARHLGDHWKKTVKEYKKQYQDARIHWKRLIQGVSKTPIPYI